MSENIVNRKDLAFLTNVVGVELLSFSVYAAYDKVFQGGFHNDVVQISAFISALLIAVTYALLNVRALPFSERVQVIIATTSEVLIAFLPAGISNLANGQLLEGTIFVVLSIVGVLLFLKFVSVFKRMFIDRVNAD